MLRVDYYYDKSIILVTIMKFETLIWKIKRKIFIDFSVKEKATCKCRVKKTTLSKCSNAQKLPHRSNLPVHYRGHVAC